MDEWDAVFHMSFINEKDRENYLLFLKLLLKGQSYVELAYMTGVLPIAKYSDGSELNMFLEYNMATRVRFSEYFGFSDEEVDKLYERYLKNTKNPQITRESIREWYDGYHTAAGERLYNPRSVVCALTDNQLSNYWVSSGKYDSIFTYIKSNVDEIQNDLTFMFAGEKIPSGIQEYAATAQELKTKEEIYSAMVVYGLLTYDQGMVFIPNKELMEYIKKYQGTFLSGRGTINMEIRKATINDLDSIAAVEAECFPPAEAATKEEFSERIKYYGDHFWLMYDDEKLIAFVDGFVTDEADLTDEMYEKADMHDENGKWQMIFGVNTIPAYRKNGYAGQLLEAAIVDAKAQGRKGLVLTCKDWLVHYYAKFGFKDEGVSDKSVHGGVVWHQMRLVF